MISLYRCLSYLDTLQSLIFADRHYSITAAGFTSSVQELVHFFEGMKAFALKIASFTGVLGIETLLLLLSILIISAGLTSLGLPRGRGSFVLSLGIADAVWMLWKTSFHEPLSSYLHSFLRANLIVVMPAFLFLAVSAAAPGVWQKLRAMMYRIKSKKGLKGGPLYRAIDEIQIKISSLQRSILQDMHRAPSPDDLALSSETARALKDLKETLARLKIE